jgi:hypothetical protein
VITWRDPHSFGAAWDAVRRSHAVAVLHALDSDAHPDAQIQALIRERRVLAAERDTFAAASAVLRRTPHVFQGVELMAAEIRGWTRDALRTRQFVLATLAVDGLLH